jgi:hypothetical protein
MSTNGLYGQFDDSFATGHSRNSANIQEWKGIVRFYEGTLTSDFVYCDDAGPNPSGNARFTRTQPVWWNPDVLQGGTEGGATHNLTINWDCTASGTMCNVQTVPQGACDNPCKLQ